MSTQRSIAFGPALLISMALFVGGTFFGVAVLARWRASTADVATTTRESEISRGEWNALRASVAGIEGRLQADALESPTQRAPVDAVSLDPASLEAVTRSASELQATLDRMRSLADSAERQLAQTATTYELAKQKPESDGSAVDAVLDLYARDPVAATREVRFASPNEILRRFGAPVHTSINDKNVQWTYGHDNRWLYLEFAQGTVLNMFVSQ
ncbi:MAG: hypothetical protein K8S98_18990 [Planctomycetes bacterium]|nr:hypothetical protein [Planctomycetota bacterium]